MAHTKTLKDNCSSIYVSYDPDRANDQNMSHDAAYDVIRFARQIVKQPYTHYQVLLSTELHSLLSVETRAMLISRHSTLTAHVIIDIPPGRPFNILVGNVSDREAHLRKHMMIANTAAPLNVIHALDNQLKPFPKRESLRQISISPMNFSQTQYLL